MYTTRNIVYNTDIKGNETKTEDKKMKISITNEMKKVITIADMPAVRKVIESMKDDTCTVKEYAEAAARIASGNADVKVLECSAEIAGNCRVWDRFDIGTAQYDVWVKFTAIINNGFGGIIMGGAYLSDIWEATGDNDEELRAHMYIRKFTETK